MKVKKSTDSENVETAVLGIMPITCGVQVKNKQIKNTAYHRSGNAVFFMLHRDPSECICHRTQQNNSGK